MEIIFRKVKIAYSDENPIAPGQAKFGEGYSFHAFRIDDLGKSRIFGDVNAFCLEFYGDDPNEPYETWANPLRSIVLERLTYQDWHWYLSFFGDVPEQLSLTGYISINQHMKNESFVKHPFNYVELKAPEYGSTFVERLYLEVPDSQLISILTTYWHRNYPASPIQGIQLPPNRIELLRSWNEKPHNAVLFREILDSSRVIFYTYPSENSHFYFLTNKMSFREMQRALDIDDLRKRAKEL